MKLGFFVFSMLYLAYATDFSLSTHVLDSTKGMPADRIEVELFYDGSSDKNMYANDNNWISVDSQKTMQNGRINDFNIQDIKCGNICVMKLRFHIQGYYHDSFYPYIDVIFKIDKLNSIYKNNNGHYHVPIILSPFGYSTYRGS